MRSVEPIDKHQLTSSMEGESLLMECQEKRHIFVHEKGKEVDERRKRCMGNAVLSSIQSFNIMHFHHHPVLTNWMMMKQQKCSYNGGESETGTGWNVE
ncbi:unnamed protein product [Onchocerca flexuosa]|uniref:Ovule protein n=1 Tax=Onchocerca flexuosa TaxID=387005 RepID=A0A183H9A1_9BILA|nr:unnamed protein product [Onchocerca flexuosa]